MLQSIQACIITIIITTFSFADVIMTELTDPQNSSDAGRYVELHNNGSSDVDLSSGWIIQRWTNGNADPTASSIIGLTGTIAAGGFYIICNDADKFATTYGLPCDQDIGTGGGADSNGDDNIAILDPTGVIADIFGVPGEDGTGTGHEFEDGRAERAESNTSASAAWDETGWNIDNDSGGGDGNQYAPEGFDPGEWIGATGGGTGGGDSCEDENACNTGDEGDCTYPETNYDCDGNCVAEVDCAGECGGSAMEDDCGECGGDGSACAEPAANLFFSEHAEGSSNNKYFEVYNASDNDVDLANYAFVNCSNGCDDWEYTNSFADGAFIPSGDVYVVCHGSIDETIISNCDETRTLYHNGDDAQGLMHVSTNTLLDIFGSIGDDPGSGWEVAGVSDATKDHTLVRHDSVTSGNGGNWEESAGDADSSEWVVLDQNTWDYMGSHPHDFSTAGCTDVDACNYNENASSDDGSCLYNDCNGECGGSAMEDDCGVCDGDGSSCLVNVTFTVDMSIEGVVGDIKVRTSTENGDYNPSDWHVMNDNGDGTFSHVLALSSGITYGYNFNNSDGSGYESGSTLEDCAGGNYGNDRYVTPGDSDMVLDTVCWESCEACPEDIPGCMDEGALNYDDTATVDDGTCIYDWPDTANLFFSEYAEGSSNNKYLEIFNGSDEDVDLNGYSLSSCSNGCDDGMSWDYPDNVTFDATVASGDVYVVCHGSSDDFILAECDQTFTYLSNGDDVFALTQVGSGAILDIIGTIGDDPGSGWEVAGVSNATKDHTLVRHASVTSGNGGNWEEAAGDADGSEWIVLDQNDWTNLGYHETSNCEEEQVWPYDCEGNCVEWIDCNGECGGVDHSCWDLNLDISGAWNFDGYADCNGNMLDTTIFYCDENENSYFDEAICNSECEFDCYSQDLEWVDYIVLGDDGSVTFGGNGEEFDTGETWGTYNGQFCIYNPGDEEHDEYASCFALYSFGDGMMFELGTWLLQYFDDEFYVLTGEDCYYQVFSPMEDSCLLGDANGDSTINVMDIIIMVEYIIYESNDYNLDCVDVNGDGSLSILDLVATIGIILGRSDTSDAASSVKLIQSSNGLSFKANGHVSGFQITLKHGPDFLIELNDNAWIADYSTNGNTSILIILNPSDNELFSCNDQFEIIEIIAANSNGQIDAMIVKEFSISDAYPNPFNPTTSMEIVMPLAGEMNVMVYNLLGQSIATLANGYMDAGTYNLTWDASNTPSGMYLLKAEYDGNISTQKLMLVK